MTSVVDFPRAPRRFSQIPARAVDDRSLGRAALVVLAALGTYADKEGWCWPSATTLAARLGIARRRVQHSLRDLEIAGYIETVRRFNEDGSERSAMRRILFEAGETVSAEEAGGCDGQRRTGTTVDDIPPTTVGVTGGTTASVTLTKNNRTNPPEHSIDADFEAFLKAYPSRSPHSNPKKPARQKFEAALKRGVPAEQLIRGASNYAAHVRRDRIEPRYIAMAQTWLHQERWTDEYRVEPAPAVRPDSAIIQATPSQLRARAGGGGLPE